MKKRIGTHTKNALFCLCTLIVICGLVFAFRGFIYSISREAIEPSIELVIMIVGTMLTFLAFYVQYLYNKRQKEDVNRERFENVFFNYLDLLLKLENNCALPVVGAGKQMFHFMFYEYKCIYNILLESKIFRKEDRKMIERQAFVLFINGVSKSACARILENSDDELKLKLQKTNEKLLKIQKDVLEGRSEEMPKFLRDYSVSSRIRLFDGHRLRIIPFIRHLCMFVQFVDLKLSDSEEDFLFYRDTLLAQMSEHEIALAYLCYNMGKEDEFKNFIVHSNYATESFFGEVIRNYLSSPRLIFDAEEFI